MDFLVCRLFFLVFILGGFCNISKVIEILVENKVIRIFFSFF